MTTKKRNYANERKYLDRTVGDRVKRNAARQAAIKAGRAYVGDGKDVDHKTPISKGGGNTKGNTRVVSRSSNRSFARTPSGAIKAKKGGVIKKKSSKKKT